MNQALPAAVGDQCSDGEGRELTVRRASVFYPGDGYAAYDPHTGELVFRVDTYGRGSSPAADRLVLMDPAGAPILTVRRERTIAEAESASEMGGEREEGLKPMFSVKRSSTFGRDRSGIDVELHRGGADHRDGWPYRIKGCFARRDCRVLTRSCCADKEDECEEAVVEIRRKRHRCLRHRPIR